VLAGDTRRAQQALAAAERDAAAREAALAAAAGEAASLGRAHHEAQVEIRQLLQDIQARGVHSKQSSDFVLVNRPSCMIVRASRTLDSEALETMGCMLFMYEDKHM
jgi:hypothetical protein